MPRASLTAGHIQRVYQEQKTRAGGAWHSMVTAADRAGAMRPVLEDDVDHVIDAASVQKVAVAAAVMDKVDRGELRLDQRIGLRAEHIAGGSGIYHLHTVWNDELTVANVLVALLLVSDNTAVRLCGLVVPPVEINEFLAAKGLTHTRVQPVTDPHRFYLGGTTPRETTALLTRLATRTLLAPRSCDFLLDIMRWINGYHDGIRREMSSAERSRVASKYGAYEDRRHEAGVIFDAAGAPTLVYAFFADRLSEPENLGGTHPAVRAHAVLGRTLLDAVY